MWARGTGALSTPKGEHEMRLLHRPVEAYAHTHGRLILKSNVVWQPDYLTHTSLVGGPRPGLHRGTLAVHTISHRL